jgi:transposase-like protein
MRWTFRRKAGIVAAVQAGTVTATELELRHGISAEELATWITAYDAHGLDGLRVIKREPPIDLQIAERDEWRAAKLLIRRHGDQAQDEATRLANLVFFGDTWHSRWVRIGRAIEALQAPGRSERN